MYISRLMLETLLNYFNVTSKDETRPQLQGVHLVITGNELLLEATNGIVAIRSIYNIEDAKEIDVIISNTSKDILKLFLATNKLLNKFNFDIQSNIISLSNTLDGFQVYLTLIKREYPKIDNIIPKDYDDKVNNTFIINPDYLQMLRLGVYGRPKQNAIKFKFMLTPNKEMPIKITCKHKDISHIMLISPIKDI